MSDCRTSAKDQVNNNSGYEHKNVHHQEYRQVPPAKAPGPKLLVRNRRPAELKTTLYQIKNRQADDDLAQRNDPGNLLTPIVEINHEWDHDESSYRIKKCDRQKLALRDHRRESHQDINANPRKHGQKGQHPPEYRHNANAKKKNQRFVQQGNDRIRKKQSEAKAQQDSQHLSHG